MIVFGIYLLIIAAIVPKLAVLWGIAIIVLVVGVILAVLGVMGRAVGTTNRMKSFKVKGRSGYIGVCSEEM